MDEHKMVINNILPATSIARKTANDPALETYPVCEGSNYMHGRAIWGCHMVHDKSWMKPSPLGWERSGAQPVSNHSVIRNIRVPGGISPMEDH